jgi:hypothetical protein
VRTSLAAILLLLAQTSAHAHQLSGSLGVVSDAGGELWAVRLPVGLAIRDEQDRWRFVCPAIWGGPDRPLSRRLGSNILIIADSGPFEMTRSGLLASHGPTHADASRTVDLELVDETVLGLVLAPPGAMVFGFDAEDTRAILTSTVPYESVEADVDGLMVGSSTTGGVRIARYGLDGRERSRSFVRYANPSRAIMELERIDQEIFLLFTSASSAQMARVEGDVGRALASSAAPILGPARIAEEIFVVVDDALQRVGSEGIDVADDSRSYRCLEEGVSNAYVCTPRTIYALDADTALLPVFDLGDVEGPRLADLDPNVEAACEFEWLIFAGDNGLDPAIPQDIDPMPPESGCACSASGASTPSSIIPLAMIAIVRRSRARRGPDARRTRRAAEPKLESPGHIGMVHSGLKSVSLRPMS